MKKLLTLLLVLAALSPLAAMSQMYSFGVIGGVSTGGESGYVGIGGSVLDTADINEVFGMGFGTRGDIAYEFRNGLFCGLLAGIGMEIRPSQTFQIDIIVGPTLTFDFSDIASAFGFGIGGDFALSYFFTPDSDVGITLGASVYPQFQAWKNLNDSRVFIIAAQGYVAVSFRSLGFRF